MLDNDDAWVASTDESNRQITWTERARRMVAYHAEALDFINRAAEHYPVSAADAGVLTRLWMEADGVDDLILPLLDELNSELVGGSGELDTTRGVSLLSSALSDITDTAALVVVYECSWSLKWADGCGASVNLAIDADGMFYAKVRGEASRHEEITGFPLTAGRLQDALVAVYFAEATLA